MDRTGDVEPLPIGPDAFVPDLSLSADGEPIAFNTLRQGLELGTYDLSGGTRRSLNTQGECYHPKWDPSGQRLAYSRVVPAAGYELSEIIIHHLSNGSTQTLPLDPHRQASGSWLPNGKGLLIHRKQRDLEVDAPATVFASPWPLAADRWAAIDVAPDGRFLMIQPAGWENRVRHVRIVLNWNKELQRLTRRQSE